MRVVAAAHRRAEITANPVSEVVELADSDEGRSNELKRGEGDAPIERYRLAAVMPDHATQLRFMR